MSKHQTHHRLLCVPGRAVAGRVVLVAVTHHQDLLHATVLQVVEVSHCILRPVDEVHQDVRVTLRRHKGML